SLHNLARLVLYRNALGEAEQLLHSAIDHQKLALKSYPRSPTFRLFLRNHYWILAAVQVQLGKHPEAARAAEDLPPAPPRDRHGPHRAAGYLARCATAAAGDARLPAEDREGQKRGYADRALKALRQAVTNGYADVADLKSNRDFEPLRQR